MTRSAAPTVNHFASLDGTEIAVFVSGRGRPLVVLPGTTSDHTTWRFVLPLLGPRVTVHAVDRRGRGGSGDLVLYEGWPAPTLAHRTTDPEVLRQLDNLLARGERARMLEAFYRDVVLMSPAEIAGLRAAPTWAARVAAAHTVPREVRAFGAHAFDPARAARITVPVLLLVGTQSPPEIQADPEVVAAALPDARIRLLDGQAHLAHLTAPETFAAEVLTFLRG
jgi:pimeloyl-ACP methyl ester carboxylesterase